MASLNIAVLSDSPEKAAEAAHAFGKKGMADDMTFYHTVFGGKIVSVIEPTAYPKKLAPMLQVLMLTDCALVVIQAPGPALGELIITLDLLQKPTVFVSEMDLKPYLAQGSLKDSKVFDNVQDAKNFVLAMEVQETKEAEHTNSAEPLALIDHCFEVKGIGTVALGIVKRGKIAVHDKLTAYPLEQEVQVKSIQKNDQDVQAAEAGDRFGLCLKGVKSEDMPRGAVLASVGSMKIVKEAACEASLSKYSKTSLADGAVVHVCAGLQVEPAKISCTRELKPGESVRMKLNFEKPVALGADERVLLCDLNSKGSRVIGRAMIKEVS